MHRLSTLGRHATFAAALGLAVVGIAGPASAAGVQSGAAHQITVRADTATDLANLTSLLNQLQAGQAAIFAKFGLSSDPSEANLLKFELFAQAALASANSQVTTTGQAVDDAAATLRACLGSGPCTAEKAALAAAADAYSAAQAMAANAQTLVNRSTQAYSDFKALSAAIAATQQAIADLKNGQKVDPHTKKKTDDGLKAIKRLKNIHGHVHGGDGASQTAATVPWAAGGSIVLAGAGLGVVGLRRRKAALAL